MRTGKQMTEQHLIDAEAQQLLRSILPKHWILREYRPDYGLDFTLEIFRAVPGGTGEKLKFETLGEHVFIQLKGARKAERGRLKIYGRMNVEKTPFHEDQNDLVAELDTLPIQIETSELMTVQRMGSALPVLLVRVDLETQGCHFVCMNDYIEKILIPKYEDYATAASRTIHVPYKNDLKDTDVGPIALRWYGKRAKLFAAFQKFLYQQAELDYAHDRAELLTMARYFARLIAQYDFWDDTEMWELIPYYGAAVRRFLTEDRPGLMQVNEEDLDFAAHGDEGARIEIPEYLFEQEVLELWRSLTILPRNYEELCKEWFLPTPVGVLASYPPGK